MLKPSKANVDLIYTCPQCKSEHWVKPKETRLVGKILCSCDTLMELMPIVKVNVDPVYEVKEQPEVVLTHKTTKKVGGLEQQAIEQLIGFGWTQTEAKKLLDRALQKHTYHTLAELVKAAMQEETT